MNIIFIVLLALILAVVIAQFVIILIVLRRVSNGLQEQVLQKLEEYGSRLEKNETVLRDEFSRNRDETAKSASIARDELTGTFTKFSSLLEQKLTGIQDSVNLSGKQNREELALSLKSFETKVDGMRDSVEKKLTSIQEDNSAKLEKMRETVDEKLHKTLETRLGESFKLVSDRLELVQKGLGEMQTLATGVGDLKKVLSNVKNNS